MSDKKRLPTEKDHGDGTGFGITIWSWADIENAIDEVLRIENDQPKNYAEGDERMTISIALAGKYGAEIVTLADKRIREAQCEVGFDVLKDIVRELITKDELKITKASKP